MILRSTDPAAGGFDQLRITNQHRKQARNAGHPSLIKLSAIPREYTWREQQFPLLHAAHRMHEVVIKPTRLFGICKSICQPKRLLLLSMRKEIVDFRQEMR